MTTAVATGQTPYNFIYVPEELQKGFCKMVLDTWYPKMAIEGIPLITAGDFWEKCGESYVSFIDRCERHKLLSDPSNMGYPRDVNQWTDEDSESFDDYIGNQISYFEHMLIEDIIEVLNRQSLIYLSVLEFDPLDEKMVYECINSPIVEVW